MHTTHVLLAMGGHSGYISSEDQSPEKGFPGWTIPTAAFLPCCRPTPRCPSPKWRRESGQPVDRRRAWKRIQKLEAEGIIKGRVALLDPRKLGLGLTVFVSVETADHSEGWLARFAEVVSAMPEVMEFYRMAGDVDYMLRVVVADMDWPTTPSTSA